MALSPTCYFRNCCPMFSFGELFKVSLTLIDSIWLNRTVTGSLTLAVVWDSALWAGWCPLFSHGSDCKRDVFWALLSGDGLTSGYWSFSPLGFNCWHRYGRGSADSVQEGAFLAVRCWLCTRAGCRLCWRGLLKGSRPDWSCPHTASLRSAAQRQMWGQAAPLSS